MVTKMYIFLYYTLYNFYARSIFAIILAYMTSMEYKLSNDI